MSKRWVPHDERDEVIDYIDTMARKCAIKPAQLVRWLGMTPSKYYDWRNRYGMENQHNGRMPRDFWLHDDEKAAIVSFFQEHPDVGYRRLTYMMNDADIVAVSPKTTYRVLRAAGLMGSRKGAPSKKGTGFDQPLLPHEHWHTDVSYININGTFYYFSSILDGYSRSIIQWDIKEKMTETDIEILLQAARESHPEARPRMITDNGPQYLSRDFKEYIRNAGMTHVRTSPYYPQSNGKIESFHKTLKNEVIRPQVPLSLAEALEMVGDYVQTYNTARLHSGIGYIAPADKLAGRADRIHSARDQRLSDARRQRRERHHAQQARAS